MKATMNDNVKITEYNKDLIEFAQTIDFTDLFDRVREIADVKCQFQTPKITTNYEGSVFIQFESDNIADQCGPFGKILESCQIENFSGYVTRDRDTGEIYYWLTVSLRYRHIGGGSNGMDLCRAQYNHGTWMLFNVEGALV